MNFKLGKMFAVGVSSLALSSVTTAQIDEIIVTANKKEQTLQDIPMSVTVTSAEQIEQSAIVDLLDLQSAVPSLRMTQLQKTTETNFIIRGFGNGANNPGIELNTRVISTITKTSNDEIRFCCFLQLSHSERWNGGL